MIFEVGKYYRHTTGNMLHAICEVETAIYGETIIAETPFGDFRPIGNTDECAVNWAEIPKEEWDRALEKQ